MFFSLQVFAETDEEPAHKPFLTSFTMDAACTEDLESYSSRCLPVEGSFSRPLFSCCSVEDKEPDESSSSVIRVPFFCSYTAEHSPEQCERHAGLLRKGGKALEGPCEAVHMGEKMIQVLGFHALLPPPPQGLSLVFL